MQRIIDSSSIGPMPPEMERAIKHDNFLRNMQAVAKEFNLHVFWNDTDKKSAALAMPWK